MKATGIVRRIDDLGRVVIPKEIRRTMHIREGAPLEIYTSDEGDIIFRKYSPLGEFLGLSAQCADATYRVTRLPVVICDRERIVAAAGANRKEWIGRKVSAELERAMRERTELTGERAVAITEGESETAAVLAIIVASSDVVGCVALTVPPERAGSPAETHKKFADLAAAFLGKQIEE